jgi:hypothetical protein
MSKPGFPIDASQTINVSNHYTNSSGQTFNGTDPCFIRSHYEDKDGGNSPGWPHVLQTNGYLRSIFHWNQSPLTVNGSIGGDTFGGNWGNSFGLGFDPNKSPHFSMGDELNFVRERLIGKLIDKVQTHRVNLGEILQTRAQCASMVVRSATRIASAFNALKRGNFSGAATALTGSGPRGSAIRRRYGGIPEQWLAYRYGWQPLVQDVYNSCEAVRRAWNDDGELFTAKASASTTGSYKELKNRAATHGPEITWSTLDRRASGVGALVYGVDSNFGSSLSQLGITNPASLAWELLPYSFVVDWFYPVGSFLERMDYSRGLVFKYGWLSIKLEQRIRSRITDPNSINPAINAHWTGGDGSGTAMVFTREALGSFPTPPPPRFKDPFSLTHVANALSLLATAFGR